MAGQQDRTGRDHLDIFEVMKGFLFFKSFTGSQNKTEDYYYCY